MIHIRAALSLAGLGLRCERLHVDHATGARLL
jgi:hypothetical protein